MRGEVSGGGLLLESLYSVGVRFVFINSGTEYASLIHDYERREDSMPRLITCPHEATAISMAHGYALVNGEPQAVMVHAVPGIANALGGIINAARSRVPVIVISGVTPFTIKGHEGSRKIWVHWDQDVRDIGEVVRQFVKWDYVVRSPEQIPEAVARAVEVANAPPKGPVYLAIPREWLMSMVRERPPLPKPTRVTEMAPPDWFVEEVARRLLEAEEPLILTKSVGIRPEAVELMVEVAELMGARVRWALGDYLNFPNTHPLSAPCDVSRADVILVIEGSIPWFPYKESPKEGCYKVYVGWDAINAQYTIWGFSFDAAATCSPTVFLSQLKRRLIELRTNELREAAEERIAKARRDFEAYEKKLISEVESDLSSGRLTKRLASYVLGNVISLDDVVVNEYSLRSQYVKRVKPGTYFREPASGVLGWGLGAGLGMKLASPGSNVVVVVGDGSYVFNNPVSAHLVSVWYDLPIMIVVLNDSSWEEVKIPVVEYSGDMSYLTRNDVAAADYPLRVDIAPIARGLGFSAYTIDSTESLQQVLNDAYAEFVRGKRVLVDVQITHLIYDS